MSDKKNLKQKGNIYIIKNKKGKEQVMVRFSWNSYRYPVKNFTKLYGCKNKTEAKTKLKAIITDLEKGIEPFITVPTKLNELWEEYTQYKLKLRQGGKKGRTGWKESTYVTNTNQYDKWVRKKIGHKKFSKVTLEDIHTILSKDMAHLGNSSKSFVKLMLQDFFNYAKKFKLIEKNILENKGLTHERTFNHRKIRDISEDKPLIILRKIYNTIEKYETPLKKFQTPEVRSMFYLLILTAHRIKELRLLTSKHIELHNNKFVATPDITKTTEYYHFPIPYEVKEFLEETLKTRDELFPNMLSETLLKRWKKLVEMAGVNLRGDNSKHQVNPT